MVYNIICENVQEKYFDLWNALYNKIIKEEDNTYYKNSYYLGFLNSNPIAVYINQKKIIHIVALEKKRSQTEYIFDSRKGFKYFDTVLNTPKEIIDLARNKDKFLNKCIEEVIL